MELKRTFRSGVVLLELMAAILIFALAGAICVRVLIKADEVAARSRNLSDGVNYASSAAELLRSADSEQEAMAYLTKAWPQLTAGETTVIPMESGTLEISVEQDGQMHIYNIVWRAGQEELYTLRLHRCFPEVSP